MSALKFPGGALLLHSTPFFFPAWDDTLAFAPVIAEKEKDLALDMGRNISPSLLVTMNGLHRYSKQFRHFFLRFTKLFPGSSKFFSIHLNLPTNESIFLLQKVLLMSISSKARSMEETS